MISYIFEIAANRKKRMRKKYSNQLFLLINELGYNPEDFIMSDDIIEEHQSKSIKYKDTFFTFIIRNDQDSFDSFDYKHTVFAPNYPMSVYIPTAGYANFESVLNGFKNWMKNHVKEYLYEQNEPDLWRNFKNSDKSLNIENINFDNINSFSNQEKQQILMSINELKLLIYKELKPNNEEQKLISARLDYLIDATERLNKYDWKGLVITTLIGITTTLTLDTEKGQLLFELFRRVFNSFPKLL